MFLLTILITSISLNASAFWFFDDLFGGGDKEESKAVNQEMILWYKFDEKTGETVKDSSGNGNDGIAKGDNSWSAGNIDGAITLNGRDAYVQLPDDILTGIKDITISTWIKQEQVRPWQRIFDFGIGTDAYMFLTPNSSLQDARFALTAGGGNRNEEVVIKSSPINELGEWKHLVIVLAGDQGIIYEDGKKVSTGKITVNPTDLGTTTANYIGKSQYDLDPYFSGEIDDFRIYNRALSQAEIVALREEAFSAEDAVAKDKAKLDLGKLDAITHDLKLPVAGDSGTEISWTSSNPEIIATDGRVTRPQAGAGDINVSLQATISKKGVNAIKEFMVTVLENGHTPYTLEVDVDQEGVEISPILYGAFFEDINYGADGGLYAEQIKNRSLEYDKSLEGWSLVTKGSGKGKLSVDDNKPLNENNQHYLELNIKEAGDGVGISNAGYWGILVEEGKEYNFSMYAHANDNFNGTINVSLEDKAGAIYGQTQIKDISKDDWKKYTARIKADKSIESAKLVVTASDTGTVFMDMVSLFPEDTWKNRENGLRPDLVKMLDEINPSFFRFPGGCIVEGNSLDNAYHWKETIGDLAERKVKYNLWGYYQSNGLGYHEYFQLSEDLGAEPLPILPAGLSCQARGAELEDMDEIEHWIQDALDLIEYANGPVTSKWGAKRAANGHPEPFNLKYLGVGNENWGPEYYERYEKFHEVLKAKHPEIKLITSSGPMAFDYNYARAWDWLKTQPADIVDEHMYMPPEWFLDNADRYDSYDRSMPQVFVGEYAAHGAGRRNNLEAAIAEAAFMTGLERNSDVVVMAAYAPLFNNVNGTQWAPDLIWFNKSEVFGTPSYYVQKIFSQNVGDITLPTTLSEYKEESEAITGSIGLGSWETKVEFDQIEITSDGKVLFSDDFNSNDANWKVFDGDWKVEDGLYKQTSRKSNTASYAGNTNWTNYTLKLKARKISGNEGVIVYFGIKDENNYYRLNLGGWGNSHSALEKVSKGRGEIIGKSSMKTIEKKKWYDIRIELAGNRIRTYLDGELIHDVIDDVNSGPLYYVSSQDKETGDIILKVVNSSDRILTTKIVLKGAEDIIGTATATILTSDKLTDENSFENPKKVSPITVELTGVARSFEYNFDKNSVTVLRIKTK